MEKLTNYKKFSNIQPYKPKYNQFERYPSQNENGWLDYVFSKLEQDHENIKIIKGDSLDSAIAIRMIDSAWDFNHFGFKVVKLDNPLVFNKCQASLVEQTLKPALNHCKQIGAKLVVARINGDNLPFIHALEGVGFKYYENIIWAVSKISGSVNDKKAKKISLFDPTNDDLDVIKLIAKNHQYQRGHYHCDDNISGNSANSLYAQWVQSAYEVGKLIVLIKERDKIAGYFICEIDDNLSGFLGFKYGRLQSLAIDSSFRGKGLGRDLFEGALEILKSRGCQFVDSGYATKNHLSAKLHSEFKFMSVYEEITMHLWL